MTVHRAFHMLYVFPGEESNQIQHMDSDFQHGSPFAVAVGMVGSRCSSLNVEHEIQLLGTSDTRLERLHVLNRMIEPEGLRRHQGNSGFASLNHHRTGINCRRRQWFFDQQRFTRLHG